MSDLRYRIGMVFQKPTPFPMTVFENVAFGLRLHGAARGAELHRRVEQALRDAALWDEVKDVLQRDGRSLSGGQQQRLCIARTIAVNPEVLLLDEPTAALDPISTLRSRGDAAGAAREVLHRRRHAQPAAGRARLQRDRLHVPRRAHRDGAVLGDIHDAEGSQDRRLHHRAVRVSATGAQLLMSARDVSVAYGAKVAIRNVNLDIGRNHVLALIGASGCGKSTFLRCLNRMNDTIAGARVTGRITLDGADIYAPGLDVAQLRARVGIVFQKPTPFPQSIYDNVAYGPRIHGLVRSRSDLDELVHDSLERAGLWDEVKDRLSQSGTSLSGGQQQRLCIARTIAVNPEVILMDEPTSALDPIASAKVEDLIDELRANYAIVIVTHNMQQAARVSQSTAYFHMGDLVEFGPTGMIFTNPQQKLTEDYITGRIG